MTAPAGGVAARAAALAALAAFTVAAGACGDDGRTATDLGRELGDRAADGVSPGAQACRLLTAADIEAVFGEPVARGRPTDNGCRYEVGADQSTLGSGTVEVRIPDPLLGLEPREEFESLRPLGAAVDVPDVGDGAFYDSGTGIFTVLAGDLVFTLSSTILPEPPDQQDLLAAVARAAVQRAEA